MDTDLSGSGALLMLLLVDQVLKMGLSGGHPVSELLLDLSDILVGVGLGFLDLSVLLGDDGGDHAAVLLVQLGDLRFQISGFLFS